MTNLSFIEWARFHESELDNLKKKVICAGTEQEVEEAIIDIFSVALNYYSNRKEDDWK